MLQVGPYWYVSLVISTYTGKQASVLCLCIFLGIDNIVVLHRYVSVQVCSILVYVLYTWYEQAHFLEVWLFQPDEAYDVVATYSVSIASTYHICFHASTDVSLLTSYLDMAQDRSVQ